MRTPRATRSISRDLSKLGKIQKPFNRLTHKEAADILRGPRAKELLDTDLAAKSARVADIKSLVAEKEAKEKAQGIKQWEKDKLVQELADLRDELDDLQVDVQNIPHHIKVAASFDENGDLGGSDETIISRLHERPTFVTHYPRGCKAFYMKQNSNDPTREQRGPTRPPTATAAASARSISMCYWPASTRKD
ncbi:MAG: amino acid--tRNA ligase-related protein [Planctomycetota bacterium]